MIHFVICDRLDLSLWVMDSSVHYGCCLHIDVFFFLSFDMYICIFGYVILVLWIYTCLQ